MSCRPRELDLNLRSRFAAQDMQLQEFLKKAGSCKAYDITRWALINQPKVVR